MVQAGTHKNVLTFCTTHARRSPHVKENMLLNLDYGLNRLRSAHPSPQEHCHRIPRNHSDIGGIWALCQVVRPSNTRTSWGFPFSKRAL